MYMKLEIVLYTNAWVVFLHNPNNGWRLRPMTRLANLETRHHSIVLIRRCTSIAETDRRLQQGARQSLFLGEVLQSCVVTIIHF